MKEIMAAESSEYDQGVPSFSYFPADQSTPLLFSLSRPLEALEGSLLERFAGKTLTVKEIFDQHNVDTPYIMRNYKVALKKLEAEGKVVCNPPADKRRKIKGELSLAEKVIVVFSKAKG
jgi:hypothetical protein